MTDLQNMLFQFTILVLIVVIVEAWVRHGTLAGIVTIVICSVILVLIVVIARMYYRYLDRQEDRRE